MTKHRGLHAQACARMLGCLVHFLLLCFLFSLLFDRYPYISIVLFWECVTSNLELVPLRVLLVFLSADVQTRWPCPAVNRW
jgi:hypothetical protein